MRDLLCNSMFRQSGSCIVSEPHSRETKSLFVTILVLLRVLELSACLTLRVIVDLTKPSAGMSMVIVANH